MDKNAEKVQQAKDSFNRILDNRKYADIIKDDKHLSVLLQLLEDENYSNILDIGTGTGYLAFPLSKQFSMATVYGLDIAENIIEKNVALAKEKEITNLRFLAYDGLNYPFNQSSFDLIVTRYAFHHFPDVTNAIQQMNKLLKNGGKVLVSDPLKNEKDVSSIIDSFMDIKKDGHIQFYTVKELEKLFFENGFRKANQVITDMKFPFAKKDEYINLYNQITEEHRALYGITNENGVIWVKHIDVGNTVFVKE